MALARSGLSLSHVRTSASAMAAPAKAAAANQRGGAPGGTARVSAASTSIRSGVRTAHPSRKQLQRPVQSHLGRALADAGPRAGLAEAKSLDLHVFDQGPLAWRQGSQGPRQV